MYGNRTFYNPMSYSCLNWSLEYYQFYYCRIFFLRNTDAFTDSSCFEEHSEQIYVFYCRSFHHLELNRTTWKSDFKYLRSFGYKRSFFDVSDFVLSFNKSQSFLEERLKVKFSQTLKKLKYFNFYLKIKFNFN